MMHSLRRLRVQILALMCLAAGQSLAQVSVVHTDASAAPLAIAVSTVTLDIGVDYPFNTLGVEMSYDSSQLTFQPENSTMKVGAASTVAFNDFIANLQQSSADFASNFNTPGFYSFSALIDPSQSPPTLSGPITASFAFLLADNLSGPAFVRYSGAISGDDEDLFGGTITITAVPEPETWLLWAAGLGLLARLSRRRPAPRQPTMQAAP